MVVHAHSITTLASDRFTLPRLRHRGCYPTYWQQAAVHSGDIASLVLLDLTAVFDIPSTTRSYVNSYTAVIRSDWRKYRASSNNYRIKRCGAKIMSQYYLSVQAHNRWAEYLLGCVWWQSRDVQLEHLKQPRLLACPTYNQIKSNQIY